MKNQIFCYVDVSFLQIILRACVMSLMSVYACAVKCSNHSVTTPLISAEEIKALTALVALVSECWRKNGLELMIKLFKSLFPVI